MDQNGTINGSIYEMVAANSQRYKEGRIDQIGKRVKFRDGREFVYVSTAVNITVGQVVAASAAEAELADKLTAASSNATQVIVEKASVVADEYAGGTITITAGTTQNTYKIIRNTASDGSNKATFTLEEPLVSAVTATDDCILKRSRYFKCILGAALADGVGIAMATSTAATSGVINYIWVQTRGVGSAIVGTGASITKNLGVILGASGVVEVAAAVTNRVVGYYLGAAAVSDGDAGVFWLQFD